MAKKPASKKPAAKKPAGKPLAARLKASPALVRKYQKDPGLRSKYLKGSLEKYLTPAQRQTRALNTRLNAPITPGSSTTERDLAHEAQAATTVRYGPQDRAIAQELGVAQQTERDTGSFYDQYRQALQQHQQNVALYQAGAQQALAQTAQGITGLGTDQAAQMQAQAQQAAAQQGVAPAGDLTTLANQALATRQGVMGTFQGQQALQGAAANTYADTAANVVAPGQKLSALAQARGRTRDVRQKQTDLATEKGAYNETFRDTRRQDEFKNVLAASTLNANIAQDQATAANAAARTAQSSPAGVAASATARTTATEEAKNAAKLGISLHQYRMLGPTVRAQRLKALKATSKGSASDTRYTSGPFAGMLKSDVNALTDQQAKAKVDAYAKRGGAKPKPGEPGGGPDWQTQQRQSAARSQVASLKRYAQKAKRGEAFVAGHQPSGPLPRNGPNSASAKIQASVAAPDDPVLVTAALDAVYNNPPGLSAATVRKLISAGYKPSLIAQALGVPTSGGQRSATRANRTTRPGSGSATARR